MFQTKNKISQWILKIVYALLVLILATLVFLLVLSFGEGAKAPYTLGATFRYVHTRDLLKMDWKEVYTKVLSDMQIKNLRLAVPWNEVEKKEGVYNFSDIDYQMRLAEEYNAKVILTIGRRTPGWPECHIPEWAEKETPEGDQQKLLRYIKETVNRYKDSPALMYWQIENEPFLVHFGTCPKYPVAQYLDEEIDLVKSLDSVHPVMTTDSGELSLWVPAASRGDVFGSTLYRSVYVDSLEKYLDYHLPAVSFKAKKGFLHLFIPGKEVVNIELQAEPWTHTGILNTPFEEQFKTFRPGSIKENVEFAKRSGFSTIYLWGVEYWYWAAENGHPEFLVEAKEVLEGEKQ